MFRSWVTQYLLLLMLFYEINANTYNNSNQTTSCDRTCFLEQNLGPRTQDFTFKFCMTFLYLTILITGVLGNLSTCLVIILNDNMHSTTNY